MIVNESGIYLFIVAFIAFLIAVIIAARMLLKNKGKVLLFFLLTWIFNAAYFLVDVIGTIEAMYLGDREVAIFLFKFEYSILFSMQFLFWMAFLDYVQQDGLGWKKISLGIGLTVAMVIWQWRPENLITISPWPPTMEGGELVYNVVIPSEAIFNALGEGATALFAISYLYWGILTYRAAPTELKGYARAMIVSGIMLLVTSGLMIVIDFNLLGAVEDLATIVSLLIYIALLLSVFISTIVIYKQPMILHLLPYKVYRLFISSKSGTPYYEKAWSEHEVNAIMTAGLLSAIGSFAKETLKDVGAGSIQEIRMRKGILLTEMQYSPVNIALLASKSSVDLKTALGKFSQEFVQLYKNDLYDKDGFPVEIQVDKIAQKFSLEKLGPMVNAHFSNIPSFIRAGLTTDQLMEKIGKPEEPAIVTEKKDVKDAEKK